MSSRHDREAVPMTSQQYCHLNKTSIMTTPEGTPVWMREILDGFNLRWRAVGKEGDSVFSRDKPPDSSQSQLVCPNHINIGATLNGLSEEGVCVCSCLSVSLYITIIIEEEVMNLIMSWSKHGKSWRGRRKSGKDVDVNVILLTFSKN